MNFSVLMATYNGDDPEDLSRALKSVDSNSSLPEQFVLVVDGPISNELISTIENFKEECNFFEVFFLKKNRGLAEALNFGLTKIKTDWVVRADADDFNLPNRFQELQKHMLDSIDVVGSYIKEVSGDSSVIKSVPLSHDQIVKFIKRRNPFNHMSVCYRKSAVLKAGGYPPLHLKEDYGLWAKLVSDGARTLNIDQVLVEAKAGDDLYKRRSGIKYVISEINLQKLLFELNIKSFLLSISDFILRSLVFILPSALRKYIYLVFLREKPKKQNR